MTGFVRNTTSNPGTQRTEEDTVTLRHLEFPVKFLFDRVTSVVHQHTGYINFACHLASYCFCSASKEPST